MPRSVGAHARCSLSVQASPRVDSNIEGMDCPVDILESPIVEDRGVISVVAGVWRAGIADAATQVR